MSDLYSVLDWLLRHFLLEATLKGGVILAATLGALAALRRLSAAQRHLLLNLAMVALLVLPAATVLVPSWQIAVPVGEAGVLDRPTDPSPARQASALTASAPAQVKAPRTHESSDPAGTRTGQVPTPPVGNPAALASVGRSVLRPMLLFLWLAGFLALLVRWGVGLMATVRLRRRSRPVVAQDWIALLDQLREALGIVRPVRLLECDLEVTPMTWGLRRPVILLPRGATGWAFERRRLVVAHELAHIRRHDRIAMALAHLVRALYWFNPLTWLAAAASRDEAERSCDDLVLSLGARASTYASQLVALAGQTRVPAAAAFSALAMATPSNLESRIGSILDVSRPRALPGTVHRLSSIGAAILLLWAVAACTPVAEAQRPTVPGTPAPPAPAPAPVADVMAPAAPAAPIEPVVGVPAVAPIPSERSLFRGVASFFDRLLPQGPIEGSWRVRQEVSRLSLRLEGSNRRAQVNTDLDLEESEERTVEHALQTDPIRFVLTRPAGTFSFEGARSDEGVRGSFVFTPSEAYASAMSDRGYNVDDVDLFLLATRNVSLAFVDEMSALGLGRLTVDNLLAMVIHDVTPEFVRSMQQAGLKDLEASHVIAFRIHDVTPEYVASLVGAGFEGLDADRLVAFAIHDVTVEQAEAMERLFGERLDADDLVAASIHDVTPEYLDELASSGIRPTSFDEVLAMRIHEVDPGFIAGVRALGYEDVEVDDLVAMKIHDVDIDLVKELRALGYEHVKIEDLMAFQIHGVEPGTISELRKLGYADVSIDDLVALRIHDVTVDMVKDAQADLGADVSLDEVIARKIRGE